MRLSPQGEETVRAIWQLHQQGKKPEQIVGLLAQRRVRMSRYDVQQIIQATQEQLHHQQEQLPELPPDLLRFIPALTPKYTQPLHLLPLLQKLEEALTRPVRLVVHAPPRHAKTDSILHAITYWLKNRPSLTCAYASYAANLTRSKSRQARALARRAGIELAVDAASLSEWRTDEGGGLLATSTGGPLTGHGVDIMLVDDPIKGRAEAESKLIRERIWDWFTDVVMTRIEPGGSVIVLMTRWHQDDLAGRLLKEHGKHQLDCEDPTCAGCGPDPVDGYEEIRLPAISDAGEALWPERWPVEALQKRRKAVGEYTWSSLYQGRPKPRGGRLFESTYFYDPAELPKTGYRLIIGVDLNYTEKTSADWSVAVVLMQHGSTFYVLDVIRQQTTAPTFAAVLKKLRKKWYGARIVSIFYGTEKGAIDFFRTDRRIPVHGLKRGGDKYVRAQGCAAAWNDGRILIPRSELLDEDGRPAGGESPEWVDPFVEIITSFTGVKDANDDDVDALTSAYEGLAGVDAPMDEQRAGEIGAAIAGANPSLAANPVDAEGHPKKKKAKDEQLIPDDPQGGDVGWASID